MGILISVYLHGFLLLFKTSLFVFNKLNALSRDSLPRRARRLNVPDWPGHARLNTMCPQEHRRYIHAFPSPAPASGGRNMPTLVPPEWWSLASSSKLPGGETDRSYLGSTMLH